MTPEDPRWKKKKPNIDEPVPLPQRYDPIAPMREEQFDEYKPIKKKRGLKYIGVGSKTPPYNRGTL